MAIHGSRLLVLLRKGTDLASTALQRGNARVRRKMAEKLGARGFWRHVLGLAVAFGAGMLVASWVVDWRDGPATPAIQQQAGGAPEGKPSLLSEAPAPQDRQLSVSVRVHREVLPGWNGETERLPTTSAADPDVRPARSASDGLSRTEGADGLRVAKPPPGIPSDERADKKEGLAAAPVIGDAKPDATGEPLPMSAWPDGDEATTAGREGETRDTYPALAPELPPPHVHAVPDPPREMEMERPSSHLAALTPSGEPMWRRNAVSKDGIRGKPLIAIIIDDVGIDQKRSRASIELPGPLTISFLPYGYNLKPLSKRARQLGHEILVHVPMEPLNADADPGPNALLTTLDGDAIRDRLRWNLAQIDGYVGINNHMGSKFTAWETGMRLVAEELRDQGLLFVDSWTTNESQGLAQSRALGVPSVARDIFVDHDIDREMIERSLTRIERIATQRGYAIGIGHPYDLTTEVLTRWIPEVRERGFAIVPISTVVKHVARNIETVRAGEPAHQSEFPAHNGRQASP